MKNKSIVTAAVAAGVGAVSPADAAVYTATLIQVAEYSNSSTSGFAGNIASSTATWSYDDVTNLVTQTSGLFNVRFTTAPTQTLWRTSITGLVMGNGGAASAATYVCTEGNFGGNVGASICGNYSFGANFFNESTTSWGPGATASRVFGGDDLASGTQESIATLDGMTTISWAGTTLVLSNGTCTGPCVGSTGFNNGQRWTFAWNPLAVPVPATFWLFGSALGALGWARRSSQNL